MNTASFWQKNQVLIMSIASALLLVLQQFAIEETIDWKALGVAAAVAIAGVVGNEFRGKGMSIAGIIGAVSLAFVQVQQTGEIKLDRLILSVIIAIVGLALPPFKSIGYEKTDVIKHAIKEGEKDVPTPIGPKPDKVINS